MVVTISGRGISTPEQLVSVEEVDEGVEPQPINQNTQSQTQTKSVVAPIYNSVDAPASKFYDFNEASGKWELKAGFVEERYPSGEVKTISTTPTEYNSKTYYKKGSDTAQYEKSTYSPYVYEFSKEGKLQRFIENRIQIGTNPVKYDSSLKSGTTYQPVEHKVFTYYDSGYRKQGEGYALVGGGFKRKQLQFKESYQDGGGVGTLSFDRNVKEQKVADYKAKKENPPKPIPILETVDETGQARRYPRLNPSWLPSEEVAKINKLKVDVAQSIAKKRNQQLSDASKIFYGEERITPTAEVKAKALSGLDVSVDPELLTFTKPKIKDSVNPKVFYGERGFSLTSEARAMALEGQSIDSSKVKFEQPYVKPFVMPDVPLNIIDYSQNYPVQATASSNPVVPLPEGSLLDMRNTAKAQFPKAYGVAEFVAVSYGTGAIVGGGLNLVIRGVKGLYSIPVVTRLGYSATSKVTPYFTKGAKDLISYTVKKGVPIAFAIDYGLSKVSKINSYKDVPVVVVEIGLEIAGFVGGSKVAGGVADAVGVGVKKYRVMKSDLKELRLFRKLKNKGGTYEYENQIVLESGEFNRDLYGYKANTQLVKEGVLTATGRTEKQVVPYNEYVLQGEQGGVIKAGQLDLSGYQLNRNPLKPSVLSDAVGTAKFNTFQVEVNKPFTELFNILDATYRVKNFDFSNILQTTKIEPLSYRTTLKGGKPVSDLLKRPPNQKLSEDMVIIQDKTVYGKGVTAEGLGGGDIKVVRKAQISKSGDVFGETGSYNILGEFEVKPTTNMVPKFKGVDYGSSIFSKAKDTQTKLFDIKELMVKDVLDIQKSPSTKFESVKIKNKPSRSFTKDVKAGGRPSEENLERFRLKMEMADRRPSSLRPEETLNVNIGKGEVPTGVTSFDVFKGHSSDSWGVPTFRPTPVIHSKPPLFIIGDNTNKIKESFRSNLYSGGGFDITSFEDNTTKSSVNIDTGRKPFISIDSIVNTGYEPTFTGEDFKINVKEVTSFDTNIKPNVDVTPKIDTRTMQDVDVDVVTIPDVITVPDIIGGGVGGREPPPEEKTTEKKLPLNIFFNDNAFSLNKKKAKGYNAMVKERGRYIKVNSKPLPRNKAFNRGANVTDNTTSASFKVVNAKKKTNIPDDLMFNKRNKFTEKKGVYIEKNTNRIDSVGEKLGITVKGWKANRRKRWRF